MSQYPCNVSFTSISHVMMCIFLESPKKGRKSTSDQSAREALLSDIKRLRQEVRGVYSGLNQWRSQDFSEGEAIMTTQF